MRYIFFLLCVVVFSSCSMSRVMKLNNDLEAISIPMKLKDVVIIDRRAAVDSGEIRMPLISYPGMSITHKPILDALQRQRIAAMVKKSFTDSGELCKVTLFVNKAYKQLEANWTSETETGYAEIQLVAKIDTRVITTTSYAELSVKSGSANRKKLEELYRLTLERATHQCLKELQASLDKPE